MEEQQIDPSMEPAIARRGDGDSSRPQRAGGWWDRNQDFIRRRAEARMRPAAQAAEAERGRVPAAIFSMEEERIDPAMEPAIARRGGDRDSSRPDERAGGWRARNQDFTRRRAATLNMRPAAQAESECGREPASKKSMAALPVPAAGEVRELSCAVCLQDFVTGGGGRLRTMPCSHSFHQRCLFCWLHVNRHCPMCRFAMPSRPDGELVGDDVERELVAEEEDAADDDVKFAATEECSSCE